MEQRFHEKAKRRASGGQARWTVISFFPFRLSGISSCVREERNLTQRQNCHYTWLCALRPGAAVNNRQVTLQLLPITPNCVNPRPLDHTNANRIHTHFTSSHLPLWIPSVRMEAHETGRQASSAPLSLFRGRTSTLSATTQTSI